jgi:hypothetical protein
MPEQREIDPIIVDAVQHVRDRFGAGGLRDLIEEAQRELVGAEESLRELGESDEGS